MTIDTATAQLSKEDRTSAYHRLIDSDPDLDEQTKTHVKECIAMTQQATKFRRHDAE